jgi:hypothetical protein
VLIRSDEQNTSENSGKEWKVVNVKHSMKPKKCSSYSSYHDILATNRCGVLSEIQTQSEETPASIPVKISNLTSLRSRTHKTYPNFNELKQEKNARIKPIKCNGIRVGRSYQKSEHKIMILGDSHVRGLSDKLKDTLNDKFEVIGYTKPNCDITSTNSAKGSISTLTKNYVLVIWGGANDGVKNNTKEGLRQVLNFVRTNNHTNIVLLCLLYRHDLTDWSCVNKEITYFINQQMHTKTTFK